MNVFPMIITVSTLLSLSQRGKRFKLHVVKTCKLTLFSWGNIEQTTRISVDVRIALIFSLTFTHFHESFLQQDYLYCNQPTGPKYANTEQTRMDRVFMPKQGLQSYVQRRTRLEHGFAIEYPCFQ